MKRLPALFLIGLLPGWLCAAPVEVLFVGNSYTFGRVDPAMSYNAANVRDLTHGATRGGTFMNLSGSNAFEPHPWGGVAGIFKQFTVQAGLEYQVSLSTRNAASLRGHLLNSNPASWDLRGNIGLQSWDKVVLQEQSDEALPRLINSNGTTLASNLDYFRFYADKIENFVHSPAGQTLFGAGEVAAHDLGISVTDALVLQRVASDQLGFEAAVPTPASGALVVLALALLGWRQRRGQA